VRHRVTIFIVVLMGCIFAYLYSMNKLIIFNHSEKIIQKITIQSKHKNLVLNDVKPNTIARVSIFAPFNKSVKVKVEQIETVQSIQFKLEGFIFGERLNQIEIDKNGALQHGALGLEK
jgi:hypothetical protein